MLELCGGGTEFLTMTVPFSHSVGSNRKKIILSMNVDQKSLETEFLIAICR